MIITIIIIPDIINFYRQPLLGLKINNNHMDSYYVVFLHIYHVIITKNLTILDYFHHILFIGLGVIPAILFIKSNILKLGYIAGCGFPGIVEYSTLALVKTGKFSSRRQKQINSNLYCYIRNPLAIFCCAFNYIFYMEGLLENDSKIIVIYINLLMYFNATFYNKLAIENYLMNEYRNIKISTKISM